MNLQDKVLTAVREFTGNVSRKTLAIGGIVLLILALMSSLVAYKRSPMSTTTATPIKPPITLHAALVMQARLGLNPVPKGYYLTLVPGPSVGNGAMSIMVVPNDPNKHFTITVMADEQKTGKTSASSHQIGKTERCIEIGVETVETQHPGIPIKKMQCSDQQGLASVLAITNFTAKHKHFQVFGFGDFGDYDPVAMMGTVATLSSKKTIPVVALEQAPVTEAIPTDAPVVVKQLPEKPKQAIAMPPFVVSQPKAAHSKAMPRSVIEATSAPAPLLTPVPTAPPTLAPTPSPSPAPPGVLPGSKTYSLNGSTITVKNVTIDDCTDTTLHAIRDQTSTYIMISNQSSREIDVDEVDDQGSHSRYANIPPTQSLKIPTFATHPWVFSGGFSSCITAVTARAAHGLVIFH